MGKIRKKILNLIPDYGVMPLLIAVVLNFSVYGGARVIAGDWKHHNIEGPLDGLIPFVPFTVVIYLGCYLFWIVNYILIARQGKKEVCQFLRRILYPGWSAWPAISYIRLQISVRLWRRKASGTR